MSSRTLLAGIGGLTLICGVLAAGTSAGTATAASPSPIRSDSGALSAIVTAPVDGDWSVRFVDDSGTVLTSVKHGAIALETAAGRLVADRVLSVHDDVVDLGTSKRAFTASVQVSPAGDGVYAVTVTGHGAGIAAVSTDFHAGAGERYLGLGERSDAVDHRGHDVVNRVVDGPYRATQARLIKNFIPAPGYSDRRDATYFPIPWILSTSGYGVLVDNDEDSSFELATPEHPDVNRLVVKADHLDLRVFGGPTPAEALARMTAAIGRQPAPSTPTVYGAWFQPRGDATAGVADQRSKDVAISVAQTYMHYLPCGAQDTDRERAMTQNLHGQSVAVTAYFNPMVCTNYQPVYDQFLAADALTKNADGSTLVFPYNTASHFLVSQIDFSAATGRDLFEGLLGEAVDDGYDGWMEDFGEYMPDDALSADGTPGTQMHNRYVEEYHAAAREFEVRAQRPLLRYSRSGWTDAVKESPIVWGGDPTTNWAFDGLASSVRQGLTMGTSGVSVWGPDIGGYMTMFDDPLQTPELLNRWIEYGAFTGVMRLQSGAIIVGVSSERPSVTDPEVAPIWKKYTRLRTMLYPYVAGSQDAYLQDGMPLMRHLALVDPDDARAVRTDDEYMFGSDLLVAPVTSPGATSRKVYLPQGKWIELARSWNLHDTGSFSLRHTHVLDGGRTVTAKAPIGTIPLFVRAGGVLPMLPKTVDTLSDYGDGVTDLQDEAGRRILLAAPRVGTTDGTLGPDETLTSEVTGNTWTLRVAASRARSYDVRAMLAGLDAGWTPCTVEVDGQSVPFEYDAERDVLRFTADLATDGQVVVTACE